MAVSSTARLPQGIAADLHVDLFGKRLAGPVIAASGTFGFAPARA